MHTSIAEAGRENLRSVDFLFLLITLVLTAFGLVMVFSASYYSSISINGSPFYYLMRDGMWIVFGIVMLVVGMVVDYSLIRKLAMPILVASIVTLLAVLFIGATSNGATRWIKVGPITFMPGEWAKLALIFFIAWFYGNNPEKARKFFTGIMPVVVVTAGMAVMIIMQPNLSTAITICAIAVAMMLIAGMHWAYALGAIGVGACGFAFIALFMRDSYWYMRMTNFMDPFNDMYGEG